jgi:citrate lyase subunit beta/citryl-CoA lyase
MRRHANRTYLFAPGNHARRVEKALGLGADAVILDLEDAVAIAEKPATRAIVREALARPRDCAGFVRVNAYDTEFCHGDIDAIVAEGLDGIVLPKLESAADIKSVDWLLTNLERERGLPVGGIEIMPIIETATGVVNVREIATAGTRVRRLAFGGGDYTRDLGMDWSLGESELLPVRSEMVLASRHGGLEPPVDTVFIHIKEHEAFRASCELVRGLGFQGKMCIHPDQVPAANAVFTPAPDAIAWSERIVAAFEEAEKAGIASIQVDGYFVDYPIVEKARRTLDTATLLRDLGKL